MGTSLMLGLFAMICAMRRRRHMSAGLGAVALIWLWLWSMPVCSVSLRGLIESEFRPQQIQELPVAQAIVVLGGTMSGPDAWRPLPDLSGASDRVWHAARLYHAKKAPLVVLSGGNSAKGGMPEAEAMRMFLRDLGVSDKAMLLEDRSRTTFENARFTATLLRKGEIQNVLLVTSALHMHRALAYFRDEGLQAIPAATDYEAAPIGSWQLFIPDAASLDGSTRAIKELIGRLNVVRTASRKF
jgi:uncharacterized SAM-binding protein YcdF (DUF218 family)